MTRSGCSKLTVKLPPPSCTGKSQVSLFDNETIQQEKANGTNGYHLLSRFYAADASYAVAANRKNIVLFLAMDRKGGFITQLR